MPQQTVAQGAPENLGDNRLVSPDGSRISRRLYRCAHRGMPVCRSDHGSAKAFTCAYHAWSYSIDGRLIGVPHQVDGYHREIDKAHWGLQKARAASYAGLVFATFDLNGPSLDEFLGDARWYLDLTFDRFPGGTEVLDGVHRWIIDCNSSSLPEERMMHVGMGLGEEFTVPDLPGILGPLWSEHNQRAYYRTWSRYMSNDLPQC